MIVSEFRWPNPAPSNREIFVSLVREFGPDRTAKKSSPGGTLITVSLICGPPVGLLLGLFKAIGNADVPIDYLWYALAGVLIVVQVGLTFSVAWVAGVVGCIAYEFIRCAGWRGVPSPYLNDAPAWLRGFGSGTPLRKSLATVLAGSVGLLTLGLGILLLRIMSFIPEIGWRALAMSNGDV